MGAPTLTVESLAPDQGGWHRLTARHALPRRVDWLLVCSALALSVIGCLLVWSATRNRDDINSGDPQYFLIRQAVNLAIGVALAIGVLWLGHHRLRGAVPFLYAGCVVAILLVFTPLGTVINGQRAWLAIGGYTIQPGEFAKIAVVLGMAVVLSAQVDAGDRKRPGTRAVLQSLALALVVLGLVVINDMGMAMVLGVIAVGMVFASGASMRWITGLTGAGVVAIVLMLALGILDDYQIDRLASFADPSRDPTGAGYNTAQAQIAIGAGGLFGKGLFNGSQTSGQFVPEQHTDFVFTVAGEELGFVGAGGIIVLLGIVLWRGLRIAREAPDLCGTLIAAGVIVWFAFQSFENIGMTLGIMPVVGITLPFLSYGGTSMFAAWIAIGLLQSVHTKRPMTA